MSEIIERAKAVVARLGGVCCEQDIDGKLYLEICAVLPLLIAEVERSYTVPEWRPVSVLTWDIVRGHSWWAVRHSSDLVCVWVPSLRCLSAGCSPTKNPDWTAAEEAADGDPDHSDYQCRPVNIEGAPIPWAEVGL